VQKLLLTSQLRAGLMAHDLWRSGLISAVLTGRGLRAPSEAGRDDGCDFGQWLARLGDLPEVPQVAIVRELHAHFHQEAGEVMELATTGRRAQATLAVGPGSRVDEAAVKLGAAVKDWIAAL
jgi:hypothetical protein